MLKTKTPIPAFYLPGNLEAEVEAYKPMEFGRDGNRVSMQSPALSSSLLSRIIEELVKAQNEYLIHCPVFEIINSIDKALALWSKPNYPARKQAAELLPTITGFSVQMIAAILDGLLPMYRGINLLKLLQEELGDPLVLDEFRRRPAASGMSKAYGPRLTTAVFAGNVPGLPVANIVYSLLMKSAILGKSSSEEPLFSALFAKTLSEVNPQLARCVAMVSWKGGNEAIEKQAFGASDAVIVYGAEHSVNEVRKRVPPEVRFISYGHKLSFGIIGREALAVNKVKKTAQKAARDVSLFDQQGCLSPHVFYVETGGETTPKEFSKLLADQMETLSQTIPRGRVSVDEAAQIIQLRGACEFKELTGDGFEIHTSPNGTDWTVIYEQDATFVPSCLNRTIRVKPVADASEVVALVEPVKSYLQTVGAALPEDRLINIADKMGQLGVDRISPIGKMTGPSIFWHHDGRFNLLDLIRWTDLETD
ncbi:acyl-CoA reductase [candidate division WOR-3 bacterium]|nr:acyl-CoA reductase [candidate division WOR-3 bacterium]